MNNVSWSFGTQIGFIVCATEIHMRPSDRPARQVTGLSENFQLAASQ